MMTRGFKRLHFQPSPFPMRDKGKLVATDERCMCQHPRSKHRDTAAYGHGSCAVCDCIQFSWQAFLVQGESA